MRMNYSLEKFEIKKKIHSKISNLITFAKLHESILLFYVKIKIKMKFVNFLPIFIRSKF